VHDLEGTFPFGRPSGRCAPRGRPGAAAVVLGVYPSALHVRWTHPRCHVAALAVDEEPWPFWDGADQAERIERWRRDVGWQEEWGRVDPVGRLNGSSGRAVRDQVLQPLGIGPDDVWLTDALPFFLVHRGPRTQGAAMAERYDACVHSRGLPVRQLPDRPTRARLVERAVVEERPRLVDELTASGAPLLVTLGDEALGVAAGLVDGALPRRLPRTDYGRRHPVAVQGRPLEVLPLEHPGQRGNDWAQAHEAWVARVEQTR
jgi:hypothetical protein